MTAKKIKPKQKPIQTNLSLTDLKYLTEAKVVAKVKATGMMDSKRGLSDSRSGKANIATTNVKAQIPIPYKIALLWFINSIILSSSLKWKHISNHPKALKEKSKFYTAKVKLISGAKSKHKLFEVLQTV